MLFVTRYLWLAICYLLYESVYLKLAITSKNLFLSLVNVLLVIFLLIALLSNQKKFLKAKTSFFVQNAFPLSSLNAFNVISIITNLYCHFKIIWNGGLFLPSENSFRPNFVTFLKEGGTSQVQKPCSIPPKIIFIEVHFGSKHFWVWKKFGSEKILVSRKIMGLKKTFCLKKIWIRKNFGFEKNYGSKKNFSSEKYFRSKNVLVKKSVWT